VKRAWPSTATPFLSAGSLTMEEFGSTTPLLPPVSVDRLRANGPAVSLSGWPYWVANGRVYGTIPTSQSLIMHVLFQTNLLMSSLTYGQRKLLRYEFP